MIRDIDRLSKGQYDLLIIGAGINGAAIAHMAALNGLKTALLEKGDFASGTSSKSTKLVHGGLRYLETFEFGLVREALKERTIQLRSAPHLVKPLGFILPIYKTDKRPFWMMKFGVWFYDLLSSKYLIKKHKVLSVQEVIEHVPEIKIEDLHGGILYYDGQMDDARLALENVLMADQLGAHASNYVEVTALNKESGRVIGVSAKDLITRKSYSIQAKKIVCTLGPWSNLFLEREESQAPFKARTTKGIHLVYRGKVSEHALIIPTQKDGRVFFVIPWMENSLIGTTDTDFKGHPDDVPVDEEDIDYIFSEARSVFPNATFKQEDIITTFAGLRPLVFEERAPSRISRKHVIQESNDGVTYVMGGKYTTYRKIAEECISRFVDGKPVDTESEFKLYGSGEIEEDSLRVAEDYNLNQATVEYLMGLYGFRYKDVLKLIDKDPQLREPICLCSPIIRAQVVYSIEIEMARKDVDIIQRRLSLGYSECKTGKCREVIRQYIKN